MNELLRIDKLEDAQRRMAELAKCAAARCREMPRDAIDRASLCH